MEEGFTMLEILKVKHVYWKLVDLNSELYDTLVTQYNLMEKFTRDCALFCRPITYRRIEWIEITSKIIEVKSMHSIGKFEIEDTERGIRIYGHK